MHEEFGNTCINIEELYHITKKALESRNVYLRLMYMRLNGFRAGYKVLENAGFEEEDLNLEALNAWWSCLMKSDLDNKTKEFQWRIAHDALYTFIRLHEIDAEISRLCILCKHTEETLNHVFVNCAETRQFWEWIFREFNFNTDLKEKFLYLNNYENMTKLRFLIDILGKCTIRKMRQILRKSQVLNITSGLKINFKYRLQSQLTTLYLQYKARNKTNTFQLEYSTC